MLDTGLVVAGLGVVTTVGGWIIKTYVTNAVDAEVDPVREDLKVHKAEDIILHTHIKDTLHRIEQRQLDDLRRR